MTPSRRRWIVPAIVAGVCTVVGLVVCFAATLGIERLPIVAGVVGPRNAVTLGAAVAGVVAMLVAVFSRKARAVASCAAVALVITAVASGAVMASRTVADEPAGSGSSAHVRVLSWNTNGGLVSPQTVAEAAARVHADILVLPEIDPSRFDEYSAALTAAHLDLRGYRVSDSAQLVVFVADSLGSYREAQAGPDPAKTAVLIPSSPGMPTLVALHAAQPALTGNGEWNDDLQWVESECAHTGVIAIGDFNATVDSLGGAHLGGCEDAASAKGAANTGTWPTAVPTWLGMPLDHMLASAEWSPLRFMVLTDEDRSGARHRPIFVDFARQEQ